MWSRCLWLFTSIVYWITVDGRQCGFPGRPRNGSSTTAAPESRPGDTVHYTCRPGFTLFGEEERVCLDSGIWAGRQPLCELNLALEKNALVSATLWNYRAALAVDGNADTCSFTPRTTEQRWWQVDLSIDHHVGSVALVINKDSYQEFTIFVIQLLSKSEALYKPCATFKGRFQNPRILFICNEGQGHQGRYVYIRDDRRDQDYFGLCEVEVFSYRDGIACGEPEQPIAGHVTVNLDATAIYSCDSGYRLIADPNRTCERDGRWTSHAPQCEAITCGYPSILPHTEVELLNHSTLWNTVAMYTCKSGYSFAPGSAQVAITCLNSGLWDKINISCTLDGDRNLPVMLTGKEWGPQSESEEGEDQDEGVGTPGIISIGILCSLLIILLAVLGIFLAKRFQSKKAAHPTPQSSTNDLIISNAKDAVYDDVATPVFQTVVSVQPQCPLSENHKGQDMDDDHNYSHLKHGVAVMDQEMVRQPIDRAYESVGLRPECGSIRECLDYDSVRNLQQLAAESTYEVVQHNGLVSSLSKSKGKPRRSIPSALKLFLQPTLKSSESELCDGAVPAEILALYAQVDKTKKRKYRPENAAESDTYHLEGNHVSSQTEESCECNYQPISDIVKCSQESGSPLLWNRNTKDCEDTLRECGVGSPSGKSSVPNVHFMHTTQPLEPHLQTVECQQL